MSEPDTGIPVREPAATSVDDTIVPFAVEALDVRGRVVRLGPVVDTILRRHAYPTPVARLLGEAIVLTVMLGSVLKFEGRSSCRPRPTGRCGCSWSISARPATCAAVRASIRS